VLTLHNTRLPMCSRCLSRPHNSSASTLSSSHSARSSQSRCPQSAQDGIPPQRSHLPQASSSSRPGTASPTASLRSRAGTAYACCQCLVLSRCCTVGYWMWPGRLYGCCRAAICPRGTVALSQWTWALSRCGIGSWCRQAGVALWHRGRLCWCCHAGNAVLALSRCSIVNGNPSNATAQQRQALVLPPVHGVVAVHLDNAQLGDVAPVQQPRGPWFKNHRKPPNPGNLTHCLCFCVSRGWAAPNILNSQGRLRFST
jgi:hypothetical protein